MSFVFSAHIPIGHLTPAEMCMASWEAADCKAWMTEARKPMLGLGPSLLTIVISDTLDWFV